MSQIADTGNRIGGAVRKMQRDRDLFVAPLTNRCCKGGVRTAPSLTEKRTSSSPRRSSACCSSRSRVGGRSTGLPGWRHGARPTIRCAPVQEQFSGALPLSRNGGGIRDCRRPGIGRQGYPGASHERPTRTIGGDRTPAFTAGMRRARPAGPPVILYRPIAQDLSVGRPIRSRLARKPAHCWRQASSPEVSAFECVAHHNQRKSRKTSLTGGSWRRNPHRAKSYL